MKNLKIIIGVLFLLTASFVACQKDDDPANGDQEPQQGRVSIEITDAPVDDAEISGVFVTIADIKIDGNSVQGFSRTTIDLMTYQKGNTKTLGSFDMEAKAYNEVTLVLDSDQDESGDSPGCYVEKEEGSKHKLASTSDNEIKLDYVFQNEANVENSLVIDFDLRKTVKRETNGDSEYAFVSQTEMSNAIRIMSKNETGIILGNCADSFSNSDMIVVYTYKKGTFDRNTEIQGSSQSGLQFHNAVNSSKVDTNGDFELHFLEEGEYEIHFAAYEQNQNTGQMELSGTLLVEALSAIQLGSITVGANATITANVLVTGVIPI